MENLALDQLILAIRERSQDPVRATESAEFVRPKVYGPVSDNDLAASENALGFSLPSFMRRLYGEVGNGGYGPGYGLIGVDNGATDDGLSIVELYREFCTLTLDDSAWLWPKYLIPICNLGCGMYACIDCSTADGAIIWFEPNPREQGESLERYLIPVAPTMSAWLASWLREEDWYTIAYNQSELKLGSGT